MPATAKMALLAMCDWANDEGGSLFPSVSQVATRVSCSERQAQRVLHALVEMGYLAVIGNLNGGAPGQTRQYRINARRIEKEGAEADKARAEQLAKTGQNRNRQTAETGDTHVTGDKLSRVTNEAETGDMDGSRRVTNGAETGDTHVTQSTIEPSIEPPVIQSARKRAPAQQAAQCPSDVDQQVFADWLQVRKAKRAGPVTETVMAGMRAEALAAGLSLNDALGHCCLAGWQGFKADWFLQRSGSVAGSGRKGYQPHKSARQALVEGAAAAIFDGATHV